MHPRTPIICRGLLVSFNQLKPKSLCQLPLRQRTKWKSRRVKNRTLRYMSWPGTQSHRNRHRWLIAEKLQDRQDRRSPTAGWGGRHGSISVAASVAQRSRFKPWVLQHLLSFPLPLPWNAFLAQSGRCHALMRTAWKQLEMAQGNNSNPALHVFRLSLARNATLGNRGR